MDQKVILIADDEPHYLEWLDDFLMSGGYKVEFYENVNKAYDALSLRLYRAVIVDLNIPVTGSLRDVIDKKGATYSQYPGLFLADFARNRGHRTRQVIVYSVHEVEAVADECRKLYCASIPKGRPSIFRKQIMDVLSYDPTKDPKGPEADQNDAIS